MNIFQNKLPPKLDKQQSAGLFCAIDIEMGNLPEGRLHHPGLGDFAVMTMTLDGNDVYAISDESMVENALDNVQFTQWAMHKGDFDIRHLRHRALLPARPHPGQYWDTMYIDRINWAGYFDSFSLQSVARRWLSIPMDKDTRKEFYKWDGILTPDQLHYASLDVTHTWGVAQKQNQHILPITRKYWNEIENLAFWAYLDFKPIPFDIEGWREFYREDQLVLDELDEKYKGINLGSWQQVLALLNKNGIKVKATNADDDLTPYLEDHPNHKNIQVLRDVLEHRRASHHVGTYGENWVEMAFEVDGRYYVLPSYDISSASTGRPQASDPPIQTMPVRDEPRYRTFVRADDGWKLVDGDYTQQEPGIAAFVSQDPDLIRIFNSGGDVYVQMAQLQTRQKDIDSKTRRKFKDTLLGINYGQTIKGLAKKWNAGFEETKQFYLEFQSTFPRLFEYLHEQESKTNYVETIYGRRFWLNDRSWQANNHKRNSPIQGSAVDMKKMTIGQMWYHWNEVFDFPVIIDMHDEVAEHTPEQHANRAAFLLEKYATEAAEKLCPGVPIRMEPKIIDNWLEAKD